VNDTVSLNVYSFERVLMQRDCTELATRATLAKPKARLALIFTRLTAGQHIPYSYPYPHPYRTQAHTVPLLAVSNPPVWQGPCNCMHHRWWALDILPLGILYLTRTWTASRTCHRWMHTSRQHAGFQMHTHSPSVLVPVPVGHETSLESLHACAPHRCGVGAA
jgi:hypothetical protein